VTPMLHFPWHKSEFHKSFHIIQINFYKCWTFLYAKKQWGSVLWPTSLGCTRAKQCSSKYNLPIFWAQVDKCHHVLGCCIENGLFPRRCVYQELFQWTHTILITHNTLTDDPADIVSIL
jgi:hypothetical protein